MLYIISNKKERKHVRIFQRDQNEIQDSFTELAAWESNKENHTIKQKMFVLYRDAGIFPVNKSQVLS